MVSPISFFWVSSVLCCLAGSSGRIPDSVRNGHTKMIPRAPRAPLSSGSARRALCWMHGPQTPPTGGAGATKSTIRSNSATPLRYAPENQNQNTDYSCSAQRSRAGTIAEEPQAGPGGTTNRATAGRAPCAQSEWARLLRPSPQHVSHV